MTNRESDGAVQRIAALTIEPEEDFGPRLGRRINRRILAGDLTGLSFAGLANAFVEFLTVLFGFAAGDTKKDQP